MTRQIPFPEANTGDQPTDDGLADRLLELASARTLEAVLHKALGIAVRVLAAEAGSILFQGSMPQCLRLGAFRSEALARIERWEEAVSKRLSDASWNISGASLPLSVLNLADSRLTLVNIPLLRETAVVGSLSLVLSSNNDLTAEQRQVLTRMARAMGQMASLIADFDAAQQRLNQIGVFYQAGQALVTTFDINKLLGDTMQLAANVIDAGASSIMLIDEERQELVFKISHGPSSKALRQQRIPLDEGIAGWVVQHGHPVIANNARTDPRFSQRVDVRTGFLTQSIAAVPLKIKGRIIGVLEVLNKYSGGFKHEDVELMTSIATQAAIAIENARLYHRVSEERDALIGRQESSRQELTDNLHEGPLRWLSAIRTSLDHLERLNEIKPEVVHNEITALRNLVDKATQDIHELSFEMHPIVLETQGWLAALEQYVAHLRKIESLVIHLEVSGEADYETQMGGVIFSLVQEAITNVRRHAEARNLWLSVEVTDNQLQISVRDDGHGFELDNLVTSHPEGSLGLRAMRQRAQSIGASLHLASRTVAPKRGTTVMLTVPLTDG